MTFSLRQYHNHQPQIANTTYIDATAVVIGQVTIGENSSLWPLVVARGDVNHIKIGQRSNIQDGSVLHVSRISATNPKGYPLIIGNDVTVGHKAMLHGCQIEDRVLVGMGSIILDGAIIEHDVIIGAGSLVPPNKRLVSGFLYVGSPAKQTRPLTEKEKAFLLHSANNYVVLKNEYLNENYDNRKK
ncbi:gamma carbonic anhydrase family protein [Photobacterium aquimaris]|uniref:Gamma carbonic anhydrase family protein n=1 Tax=Photobacterium aquimaris TaxID=512643 RepID=A0A2T3IFZ7_9GAMM|nr:MULTISPECIES: gamma carbonic anhydrase family protein [Photobacterium]OBU16092.1 gamma carbonic anhydrase family protein [Photobacterium aquimaris]OBU21324.1 gamma carbonic anhydrase family protein [Photobacterium aquimaris]PSU25569.1 gamma carbonic anhydrase family protein [Photobacterium aquimaris]PSV97772.1 gamma carbonic anhydrase family protein [Photobacterium aquimaris]